MGGFLSSFFQSEPTESTEQQAENHRRLADGYAREQREISQKSQAAYRSGNGGLAKTLSIEAKALHAKVEYHNKEAARLHFSSNNENCPEGTIDLHGLFVKEAIAKLDDAVKRAVKDKRDELVVIVGAGNHSEGGVQRIRPAVEKWLKDRGHSWEVMNQGCLKVRLRQKSFCCTIM